MAEKRVLIEHPKDGRRYAVTAATFKRVYEEQGFKVDRYEDGQPYSTPKASKDEPKKVDG